VDELAALNHRVCQFAADREWQQFHDPKNLVMALATEVGELTALFRWVDNRDSDAAARGEPARQAMKEEIGDVGILLLLLCARANIDLAGAIRDKIEINENKYPAERSRGKAEPPEK
jgi:NTP pyrophosphatase (non-canonical NTP hydrolase)